MKMPSMRSSQGLAEVKENNSEYSIYLSHYPDGETKPKMLIGSYMTDTILNHQADEFYVESFPSQKLKVKNIPNMKTKSSKLEADNL